jgi:hypothetical protein
MMKIYAIKNLVIPAVLTNYIVGIGIRLKGLKELRDIGYVEFD